MLAHLRTQNHGMNPALLQRGLNAGGGGPRPVTANQTEGAAQVIQQYKRVQQLSASSTGQQTSNHAGMSQSIPSIETLTNNSELFDAAYKACAKAAKEGKDQNTINKLIDTKVAGSGFLGSPGISLGEAALLKIIYGNGVLKATTKCNEKKALQNLADSIPGGAAAMLLEVCQTGSISSVKNFPLAISAEDKKKVVNVLTSRAYFFRDTIEVDKKNVARGAIQGLPDQQRDELTQYTKSMLLNAAELADSIPDTSPLKIPTCATVFMGMTPDERQEFITNGSNVAGQAGAATEQELRRNLVEYDFPRLLVQYEQDLRSVTAQVQNTALTALGLDRCGAREVADSLDKEVISMAPGPGYKILLDRTTPLEKQQRLKRLSAEGLSASDFVSFLPEGKDPTSSVEKKKFVDMLIKHATTNTLLSFDPEVKRLSPKEGELRRAVLNAKTAHDQAQWRALDAKPAYDAALEAAFANPAGAKYVELNNLQKKFWKSTTEEKRLAELQREQAYVLAMRPALEEATYTLMRTLQEETELLDLATMTRTPLEEAQIRAINDPNGKFAGVNHSALNAFNSAIDDAANTVAGNRTEAQEIEHEVFTRKGVLEALAANDPRQDDATNTAAGRQTKAEEAELALINSQYVGLTILTDPERLHCLEIAEEIVMSNDHLEEKERIAILLKWHSSNNRQLQALALKCYQNRYKEAAPDTSKLVHQDAETLRALHSKATLMSRPVARTIHNNLGAPLYNLVVSPILAIWNNKGRIAKALICGGLLLSHATPLIPSQLNMTLPKVDLSLNTGMQIATNPAVWAGATCAGVVDSFGGNPYLSTTAGIVCTIGRDYFQKDGYIQSQWLDSQSTTESQDFTSIGVILSEEATKTMKLELQIENDEQELKRLSSLNLEANSINERAANLQKLELANKIKENKKTVNEYYINLGEPAKYKLD